MKCCIIAIYQYKNFKQKEFSRIVLFEAIARFENFSTYCKGIVKEMVTTVVPKEVSENQVFLRFFANIFLLVCRMVTIFLLTQRARLSGPFKYLEHVRKVHKKASRGL